MQRLSKKDGRGIEEDREGEGRVIEGRNRGRCFIGQKHSMRIDYRNLIY